MIQPFIFFSCKMITAISSGPRQTNFELLRIVAMFLVLVVHADFMSMGEPTISDFNEASFISFCRILIEALSIICVNVFVLISGWFLIRPTIKGFMSFLFQCWFISLLIYGIALATGNYHSDFNKIISQGILFQWEGYWFIKSYLILYIFAPILNAYIKVATKRSLLIVLILFFCIQTLGGSVTKLTLTYFDGGYSPISFLGLYILSATIRRFYTGFTMKMASAIFILSVALNTILPLFNILLNMNIPFDFWSYSNPLVILEAVSLLLICARIRIRQNKMINWISASAFAVYLVHAHPLIFVNFKLTIKLICRHLDSVEAVALICLFLIVIFIASVIMDQPRKIIWNFLSYRFFRKSSFPLD